MYLNEKEAKLFCTTSGCLLFVCNYSDNMPLPCHFPDIYSKEIYRFFVVDTYKVNMIPLLESFAHNVILHVNAESGQRGS